MMQASHFPQQPGMQMPQGHMMGGPGPGHPMQQGLQMHPGVSGPNGPVSQAGPMVAGMPPGVGPNAHALSHLQPQQAHMFQQQQQQQHMMNPALIAQQRNAHQQALLQRQQQQQQQQMLAQQNGMGGMSFQHQMANMNPQQIAALQQAGNMPQQYVPLPPHLRQQMQQQQAMAQQQQQTSNPQQAVAMQHAQQQAAAHAHQQQQQQAQHQQQQQQQQQQQMQQQQAIAMQHAVSQQSNHSNPGSQGAPTTQPPQAPLRPPSAMSHQGQASPAPQPTPQQKPQQLPQSGPQPPQQASAPNQPPGMPQQPNQQPQNQPQMVQRNPAMSQPPSQQQVAAQAQAQAQAQAARLSMIQQQQQQQQRPLPTNGQGTLKLMLFANELSKFGLSRDKHYIEHWQTFVDRFFAESGSFVNILFSHDTPRTKLFEIVHAALPRYFLTLFNTEVESLQVTLDGATENNGGSESKVTCDRAKFIYTYKNQCQVICSGRLTAFWAGNEKMEWLQFETQGHQQFIPKALLEKLFVQDEINPLNANQSPRMNNKSKQKQRAAQIPAEPSMPYSKLPSAHVTEYALPPPLQSYLEVYETMNNMSSLLAYYNSHEELTPAQAMVQWNTVMTNNNPAMAQQQQQQQQNLAQQNALRMQQAGNMQPGQVMQQTPPQGMPPGARTPQNMGQPGLPPNQQFMSPAMANSLLPNGNMSSPHMMQSHTPSPASHAMVHQVSQGGSSASQNTSPNMTNKRRRSTAKIDGDDGGGPDVNGAPKVKQSPRVGGNKRAKNNS